MRASCARNCLQLRKQFGGETKVEHSPRASYSVDEALADKFASCEREGRCLAARSAADKMALGTRLRSGIVISPWRGLFARSEHWDELNAAERCLHVARSLAERNPTWVFAGVTAALAYGFSVSYSLLDSNGVRIETMADRGRSAGVRNGVRRLSYTEDNQWRASGLTVTSPVLTVFECACRLPFGDALAIADSALRSGLVKGAELESMVDGAGRVRGIRRARRVVQYMDGRAESGGESQTRARMIELGYEVPDLQVEFANPLDPKRNFRVDMLVDCGNGRRVAVEHDGACKYEDLAMLNGRTPTRAFMDERQREALLTSCGIEVMRVRWADLHDEQRFRRLMDAYGVPKRRARGV